MKASVTRNRIDRISPEVAAIDIGKTSLYVAVAASEVKCFGTVTCEMVRLAEYLEEQGVKHVAMEATGIYWIPLHDYLDTHGFEVTVFNGAHARNLPGRKTDVADCQWHAMLHSHGLLQPCFIPPAEIRELRDINRIRDDHAGQAAMSIQHMQKALDRMNVRLHNEISQLNGVSGFRIIEAILRGERDAEKLAALCEKQILNKKRSEVIESLQGTWEKHHIFALRQAVKTYRHYHELMVECDKEIEQWLDDHIASKEIPPPPSPADKKWATVRHNAPEIPNLHEKLVMACDGRDPVAISGLGVLGNLKLVSELGTDLSAWTTEKHFTSWLGLAPGNHQSGKRNRRVRRRKTKAGQIFRECAMSITKSKYLALGAFYRRIKGRRGAAVAITAVARKLAELYYRAMTKGMAYVEEGVQRYEAAYKEQQLRYLQRTAAAHGYSLVETTSMAASTG